MANARPGYKRIMGEIPEEMHEKITLYNKISDRPLNVSRAIELCITQAWKKIEAELITEASDDEDGISIDSDVIYKAIKKDIDVGEFEAGEIYKHFIKLLKKEDLFKDIPLKQFLYPVDRVQHAGTESEPCIPIIFMAKDIYCFALSPDSTYEELFNEKFRDDIYHWPSD
jgi:hypothetical protein